MNKLFWSLLISASFLLTPLVFAQNVNSAAVVAQPKTSLQVNSETQGLANHQQTSSAKGKHKGPSQVSINACQSKSEGDACEMTTSHGTRAGVCSYTTDKKYLFCKRNHRKHAQK